MKICLEPSLKQQLIVMGVLRMFMENTQAFWKHSQLDEIHINWIAAGFSYYRSPQGGKYWEGIENRIKINMTVAEIATWTRKQFC